MVGLSLSPPRRHGRRHLYPGHRCDTEAGTGWPGGPGLIPPGIVLGGTPEPVGRGQGQRLGAALRVALDWRDRVRGEGHRGLLRAVLPRADQSGTPPSCASTGGLTTPRAHISGTFPVVQAEARRARYGIVRIPVYLMTTSGIRHASEAIALAISPHESLSWSGGQSQLCSTSHLQRRPQMPTSVSASRERLRLVVTIGLLLVLC
jgi:hypothetical protein